MILWRAAILAVFWGIWLERNNIIFYDKGEEESVLWDKIKYWVSLWVYQVWKAFVFRTCKMLDSFCIDPALHFQFSGLTLCLVWFVLVCLSLSSFVLVAEDNSTSLLPVSFTFYYI